MTLTRESTAQPEVCEMFLKYAVLPPPRRPALSILKWVVMREAVYSQDVLTVSELWNSWHWFRDELFENRD